MRFHAGSSAANEQSTVICATKKKFFILQGYILKSLPQPSNQYYGVSFLDIYWSKQSYVPLKLWSLFPVKKMNGAGTWIQALFFSLKKRAAVLLQNFTQMHPLLGKKMMAFLQPFLIMLSLQIYLLAHAIFLLQLRAILGLKSPTFYVSCFCCLMCCSGKLNQTLDKPKQERALWKLPK